MQTNTSDLLLLCIIMVKRSNWRLKKTKALIYDKKNFSVCCLRHESTILSDNVCLSLLSVRVNDVSLYVVDCNADDDNVKASHCSFCYQNAKNKINLINNSSLNFCEDTNILISVKRISFFLVK